MNVILYAAMSLDGFIALSDDSTPWSDDEWHAFEAFVKSCDACVMGKATYNLMKDDGFIVGPKYYIATSGDLKETEFETISIASRGDLPAVDRIGIIGGSELNGRLLSADIVDKMILDIEPLVFGTGVRLFKSGDLMKEFKLISINKLSENTLQLHYKSKEH